MELAYLGFYTFAIVIIWGFFIVAKIHLYKFKDFSSHIKQVTIILAIFLAVLTILWYIIIFSFWFSNRDAKIDTSSNIEENYY